MTTALEEWANQHRSGGSDRAANEHAGEPDGSTGPHGTDEAPPYEGQVEPGEDRVLDDGAADAAALAKKKKGMQIIMVAAGVCAVLFVGVVGVAIMKRSAAQQPVPVELAEQQQSSLQVAPVGAPASSPAPGIITESAADSPSFPATTGQAPVAPVGADFGLQAGVGAPAMPVSDSTQGSQAAKPVTQPSTQAATPGPVADVGGQKPQRAPELATAAKPDVAAVELDKLRADLTALRADLAAKTGAVESLRGEVNSLRAQLSARPAAPKPVIAKPAPKEVVEAPKTAATPAVVVVTETVRPSSNPAAAPAAATSKGKVRTDFRIYAAVDGRFWVVGPDNEPVQVGARSPLSDGSRVTSIDAEKNIVFTTAGEIR